MPSFVRAVARRARWAPRRTHWPARAMAAAAKAPSPPASAPSAPGPLRLRTDTPFIPEWLHPRIKAFIAADKYCRYPDWTLYPELAFLPPPHVIAAIESAPKPPPNSSSHGGSMPRARSFVTATANATASASASGSTSASTTASAKPVDPLSYGHVPGPGDAAVVAQRRLGILKRLYGPAFAGLKQYSPEWLAKGKSGEVWAQHYPLTERPLPCDGEFERASDYSLWLLDVYKGAYARATPTPELDAFTRIARAHQSLAIEGNPLSPDDMHHIDQQMKEWESRERRSVIDPTFVAGAGAPDALDTALPASLLRPPRRTEADDVHVRDTRNHLVCQALVESWLSRVPSPSQPALTVADVKQLHAVLMSGQSFGGDDGVGLYMTYSGNSERIVERAGEFRRATVSPRGYDSIFPYPLEVPALMNALLGWCNDYMCLPPDQRWSHPFVFAARFCVSFLHVHPFSDGNGRVGRLLHAWALQRFGYEPVVFDLFEAERFDRVAYCTAVQNAQLHRPDAFMLMALEGSQAAMELKTPREMRPF